MTSEGQQISVLEEILGEKQLHPNAGGLYWADSNGGLYKDGNLLTNAPFSANWSWIGHC
jgi:hypothetical protein